MSYAKAFFITSSILLAPSLKLINAEDAANSTIEICNYPDDTSYAFGPNIENVIIHLENGALKINE